MKRIVQFDTQMLEDGFKPTEAMIYGYLWWCTRKTRWNGEIKPSIGLLKKTLSLGRMTIIRGIQRLEEKGLIGVAREDHRNNTYYVLDMTMYPAITNYDYDRMIRGNEKKIKIW